jgi:hypothetical protein
VVAVVTAVVISSANACQRVGAGGRLPVVLNIGRAAPGVIVPSSSKKLALAAGVTTICVCRILSTVSLKLHDNAVLVLIATSFDTV